LFHFVFAQYLRSRLNQELVVFKMIFIRFESQKVMEGVRL